MKKEQDYPIFKHLSAEEIHTFKIMDKMYSVDNGVFPATDKTLHFYGQFISDLPKEFQPNGPNGHQYIKCKSIEEAEIKYQKLRKAIYDEWPDTYQWSGKGWHRWMIHDQRQMTLEFEK